MFFCFVSVQSSKRGSLVTPLCSFDQFVIYTWYKVGNIWVYTNRWVMTLRQILLCDAVNDKFSFCGMISAPSILVRHVLAITQFENFTLIANIT